ncbi:MAG: hypothetical protein PUP93_25880, partial [Rhizonema sp. NSF051]|nr:hypothetical protein [Rhizonema sp. NSF051]
LTLLQRWTHRLRGGETKHTEKRGGVHAGLRLIYRTLYYLSYNGSGVGKRGHRERKKNSV